MYFFFYKREIFNFSGVVFFQSEQLKNRGSFHDDPTRFLPAASSRVCARVYVFPGWKKIARRRILSSRQGKSRAFLVAVAA